jgi:GYF domain 2
MKQWYYAQNGERKGPVDLNTIQSLFQEGQINGDDLVWEEGMADWVKADKVLTKIPVLSSTTEQASFSSTTSTPNIGSAGEPLPDFGGILCWGIAIVLVPCLGFFGFIALMVLHILELIAVRKGVTEGRYQRSQYSEVHPALMGLGLFCCSIVFYPLFMHWRNETKLFQPQPHAVWFSIAILALGIIVGVALQVASMLMQGGLQSLGQ